MRGSRSLQTYLLAFAIVLILPLFAIATLATYNFAEAERARLEGMADNANQDIVLQIDREISSRVAFLQSLAALNNDNWATSTRSLYQFELHARELAQLKNMQFVMVDADGRQLLDTSAPRGALLPAGGDSDFKPEEMSDKDVYVSNLLYNAMREPLIKVSVPIRHDGKLIAVLSTTLTPARITQLARDALPAGPFFATVTDRTGIVIARSLDPDRFIGKPATSLFNGVKDAKGVKGSASILNLQGVPIFAYWRRPATSGWIVAAAVSQEALTAPLRNSLKMLAIIGLSLVALALGAAFWIGRQLTSAHASLEAAARDIGQLRWIVPFNTPLVEANHVGRAMVEASILLVERGEALERVNQELEDRVQSRTKELNTKTALLETTLDTMMQGLIVIEPDGKVPFCNAQARQMLELGDDFQRNPTIDYIVKSEGTFQLGSPGYETSQRLRPHYGSEPSVFEYERHNGVIMRIQTVPVIFGGGFVQTYSDVTEQTQRNRDLDEARKSAEHANRAKGDFLATISHEMRTPLHAMIGYSDLLAQEKETGAAAQRYAKQIQHAGAALLCLVDDVLDLAKIEAGRTEVRSEIFNLQTFLDSTVSIVQPQADAKNLRLELDADRAHSACFIGDIARIRQILMNLMSNAIKFTASGSVKLRVRQRPGKDNNTRLRFTVVDTGIGIALADQEMLFQRFHQVDPSNSRRFGGAGLGLAISKQLVDLLGGRIGVASRLGKGSRFWFEITLRSAESIQTTSRVITSKSSARRILVVDDVVLSQDLFREFLERAGHKVEVASNGREAVEAARKKAYDVILMDMSMPEMDGLEATRLIRAENAGRPQARIIICTANAQAFPQGDFKTAGVDAVLRKPLGQAELYATIDGVLKSEALPAKAPPDIAPEAIDGLELLSLLGPVRLIAALEVLKAELCALPTFISGEEKDLRNVGRQAHAMITTACMLNMPELADGLRELENACDEQCNSCNLSCNASRILEDMRPIIEMSSMKAETLSRQLKSRIMH